MMQSHRVFVFSRFSRVDSAVEDHKECHLRLLLAREPPESMSHEPDQSEHRLL